MTGYQKKNYMVRSVHKVAMYSKVHIVFNFPISRKLWYLVIFCFRTCQILQLWFEHLLGTKNP